MRILALDFDGVVFDSARESFAVALRSYLDLRPASPLRDRPRGSLYRSFVERMPLGNRAEDYGTVLTALEQAAPLPDQPAYDRFRAQQDADWLGSYHERFYEVREAMSIEDREGWLELMRPYEPFVATLRRRAADRSYAIATAKDRRSVDALLEACGLADLFDPRFILDKETGSNKARHLERLQELSGERWADLTFVDDKVNHLDSVAPLGVRCVLAGWGYNGPREHELAESRGYLVCTLDDFERRVF